MVNNLNKCKFEIADTACMEHISENIFTSTEFSRTPKTKCLKFYLNSVNKMRGMHENI